MPAEQEPSIEGYVPSQWWFDLRQERDRLQTRVKSLEAEIQAAQERIANFERWGARKFSEGDPVEVHPPDSRAESQAGLNGPSGSPTSPSERALQALTWISDPSYVGNYAPLEVIEIYRKWAQSALAAQRTEEARDG